MSEDPVRDTTCLGCGLTHRSVEAGGVWHCPNPCCRGVGAAAFRSRLKSYLEVHDGYTVDPVEALVEGLIAAKQHQDPEIYEAAVRMIPFWASRMGEQNMPSIIVATREIAWIEVRPKTISLVLQPADDCAIKQDTIEVDRSVVGFAEFSPGDTVRIRVERV